MPNGHRRAELVRGDPRVVGRLGLDPADLAVDADELEVVGARRAAARSGARSPAAAAARCCVTLSPTTRRRERAGDVGDAAAPRLWPFEPPGVVSSALAAKTTRSGSRGVVGVRDRVVPARVAEHRAGSKYWRTVGEKPTDSPNGLKVIVASQSGVGVRPRTVVPNDPDRPTLASRAQKPSPSLRPAAPVSTRRYDSSAIDRAQAAAEVLAAAKADEAALQVAVVELQRVRVAADRLDAALPEASSRP